MQTIDLILPYLNTLTTTAGAGALASWLFDQLRAAVPAERALDAHPLVRLALVPLHSPRYARLTVLILSALISLAATSALALAAGRPLAPDVDACLAAALAAIASQVSHGFSKPAELPEGLLIDVELATEEERLDAILDDMLDELKRIEEDDSE